MTVIEIRPHRLGWKVLNLPASSLYLQKGQAIDYAQSRACFCSGEIRMLNWTGKLERMIAFSEADRKL
jgi:hypothetical protein